MFLCVCVCLRALLTLFEFCNNFFPFSVFVHMLRAIFSFSFLFCALSFARSLAHSAPKWAIRRKRDGQRGVEGVAIDNKQP